MFIMLYCFNPHILGKDTPCLTYVGDEMGNIMISVLSILVFANMPFWTQPKFLLNHSKQ